MRRCTLIVAILALCHVGLGARPPPPPKGALRPPPPAPIPAPVPGPTVTPGPAPTPGPTPNPTPTPTPVPAPGYPASPFGVKCPTVDGVTYFASTFPSSPFVITPFQELYAAPPVAVPKGKVCRPDQPHCLFYYENDVIEAQLRAFDAAVPGCKALPPTW